MTDLINEYVKILESKTYSVESINKSEVNAELYNTLRLMKCLQHRRQS